VSLTGPKLHLSFDRTKRTQSNLRPCLSSNPTTSGGCDDCVYSLPQPSRSQSWTSVYYKLQAARKVDELALACVDACGSSGWGALIRRLIVKRAAAWVSLITTDLTQCFLACHARVVYSTCFYTRQPGAKLRTYTPHSRVHVNALNTRRALPRFMRTTPGTSISSLMILRPMARKSHCGSSLLQLTGRERLALF